MPTINTNNANRSYTITGLTNDVTYKVRVAAVNEIGTGPFTEYVYATPSLFSVDNQYYNVELLMDMEGSATSDPYYGNTVFALASNYLGINNDPYALETKLLLHGNNLALIDSSLSNKGVGRSSNTSTYTSTTTDGYFGSGSILFNGDNWLSFGSSEDFSVGTGDFTIECFVKFLAFNTNNPICNPTVDNSAGNDKWYWIYSSNSLVFGRHNTSDTATASWSPSTGTWYHIAVVRVGGTIKMYIDGAEQTVSNSSLFNGVSFNQNGFNIGRVAHPTPTPFNGQIDEFRFTKGVARTITVPSSPYPDPVFSFKDVSPQPKQIIVVGDPAVTNYTDPPAAPSGLMALESETGDLLLKWNPDTTPPEILNYTVEYSTDGGVEWTPVTNGVFGINNVTINNLSDGFYIFRISSNNGIGQSPWSTVDVQLPFVTTAVEYLVVAGGGGGGNDMGGGGGGGGVRSNVDGEMSGGGGMAEPILLLDNGATYTITVGGGGSGAPAGTGGSGTNGGNSVIATATTTGDAFYSNTSLLLHMDGAGSTFVDSSPSPKTITAVNGTTQSSAQSKFGGKSAAFVRSSNQYLTVPASDGAFTLGAADFAIEAWVRLSSLPSSGGYPGGYWICGWGATNSNSGFDFYITDVNIVLNLQNFASPTVSGTHGMVTGQWYHVAAVRSGTSLSLYIDGILVATATSSDSAYSPGDNIAISAAEPSGATSGNWDGFIDDFRITKGSNRGYTGSTIAIPNSAFPDFDGSLIKALGGGYGASKHNDPNWNANNGGCGGGGSGGRQQGSSYGGLPGNGTANQGFNGASSGYHWYPGGGGGAGGAGFGGGYSRGHGGPGVLNRILGTVYYWAGGGGASGYSTTGGDGGIGGGGGGAVNTTYGGAGLNNGSGGGGGSTNSQCNTPGGNAGANTGGGGGGGSHYQYNNYGGSGGAGIVVLRSKKLAASTTGSPTVTTNNGYNIYMFTGAGSISFAGSNTALPPVPKNIVVSQDSSGDVLLTWDAIHSSFDISDYVIQYKNANDNAWTTLSRQASSANSATISGLADGNYYIRIASVNSNGQSGWKAKFVTLPLIVVNYLVVAGGGGGGGAVRGGGAGAGGYRSSVQGENSGGGAAAESNLIVSAGATYTIVVGAGGASGPFGTNNEACGGTNGNNSSFGNILSIGGGAGGASDSSGSNRSPNNGGSGGGGWYQHGAGGTGTTGQGYAGGSSSTSPPYGAGGGGAGGVGGNAQSGSGGFGGVGVQSNITGTPTYRAGGGSSSNYGGNSNYAGGNGGGGIGRNDWSTSIGQSPSNGTSNTGGGGGASGNGGSGVVILRCSRPASSTTGSPTVTTDGNNTIYTFTDSGTITF